MPVPGLRESEGAVSAWSDFTDSVTSLGTAGVDAYNTYKNANAEPVAPIAPAASGLPSWALPAGIGAIVLVLVLVFATRK